MVKIFEVQHQYTEIRNVQSRIIEAESFESYLESVEDSLPTTDVEVGQKYVDYENQSVIFMFEHNLYDGQTWLEFVHFAQVIK